MLRKKDWLLLGIAAAQGQPVSPVVLQKCLFLLGQKCRNEVGTAFFEFEPYHYGPFSKEIYQTAESLHAEGYVSPQRPPGQQWTDYVAMPHGLSKAAVLKQKSGPAVEAVDYLGALVLWARQLSFPQLVSAIYDLYPDYSVNSLFSRKPIG